MTMRPLKISVVTPSYNQGQYIEETILSVLGQDYPHVEYIVIDGCSTDHTVEIIRKYEDLIAFWVSEPDSGQSEAINKGWKKCTGDIVAWLNTDDTYSPGALSAVAEAFGRNPGAVLVHGATHTLAQDGKTILFTSQPLDMDPYGMVAGCGGVTAQPSIFLRRKVFDEIGHLNPHLHYVMDWEYWIRIGLHFGTERFCKIPDVLSNNRDWSGTKTNRGWEEICRENRRVLTELFRKRPGDQRLHQIRAAAYRSSFRKQAELARLNGRPRKALSCVCRAWSIEPLGHNPSRELAILLYLILGRTYGEKLKSAISPVREKLNRVTGY